MVEGFAVENELFQFLDRELRWDPDVSKPEDAWIHTPEQLSEMFPMTHRWDRPPKWIYPAHYEDGKVQVLGNSLPFNDVTIFCYF